MSLTGSPFFCFVIALSVLAFAAAVLGLPRVQGRGARAIAGRAGALLTVNVLVVLTVLVGANDRYSFFADWQDVRGALLGSSQSAATYSAGAPLLGPTVPPQARSTGGTQDVRHYEVTGSGGLRGEVMVTLPRDYDDPLARDRSYPVLETFHGYPGTPEQWNRSMAIRRQLDTAAARHEIGEVITLSPTWEFPRGVDSECVDGGAKGPDVEAWLTRDVPAWAERTFRIAQGRSSWATIGISAGGWCAAMATMLHPAQYSVAIVLGGYFAPEFSPGYRPFSAKSEAGRHYDLVDLARRRPPPVALWVQTSRSDSISGPSTLRLLKATHSPLTLQAVVLKHAGHRLGIWAGELPTALAWLGQRPGFQPS